MTIRNVVIGRLRGDAGAAERAELDEALAGIRSLDLPGMMQNRAGLDLGLRAGGGDFAITNDWTDAQSYRAYDADPLHNEYRARIVAVAADVTRVQFQLD